MPLLSAALAAGVGVCAHVQAWGYRIGGAELHVWGCVRMCRHVAAGVGGLYGSSGIHGIPVQC
eukprot:3754875-Pyramimonas_sp.AAC.1